MVVKSTLLFLWMLFCGFSYAAMATQESGISLSDCARQKSEAALKIKSRDEIRNLSLTGMACANKCLKKQPQEPRCLYYRAVNRGLLLETGLANPKAHLKELVADFKRAAELAPAFDGAGAFRALGYIYLKLPAVSLWGDGYSRDLSQAKAHASEALRLNKTNPANLQLAGEIAFAEKEFKTARGYFKDALQQFKKLKLPTTEKASQILEIEKWIRKTEFKLNKS